MPQLVLGTVQWGLDYGIANRTGRPSAREVDAMLRRAGEDGVWTLDTARLYGESEEVIGSAIGADARWTIVTKLAKVSADSDPRSAALASVEASRRALRRDRIDVLLLHDPRDRAAPGVWDALSAMRQRGEIGALGISAVTPDDAIAALDDPSIEALQVAASLLDQRLRRSGFFDRARAAGKRVFVRSAFLQGVVFMEPDSLPPFLGALAEPLRRIRQWAERNGTTVEKACLAYVRDVLAADPVVGCERADQLEKNLEAFRGPALPALDALEAAIPPLGDDVVNPARWPTKAG